MDKVQQENTIVYLGRGEAIKFVRKSYIAGIAHFVRGGAFLYKTIPDESGDARGWDNMCWIKTSQSDAIQYISSIIPEAYEDCKLKITLTHSVCPCIFIG